MDGRGNVNLSRCAGVAALAIPLVSGCYIGSDRGDSGAVHASSDTEGPADEDGSTTSDTGDLAGEDGSTTEGGSGAMGDEGETPPTCADEAAIFPGDVPIRRLTRFEYNNTVRDLLGDHTAPASALPSEVLGNGFGNDAEAQSVSTLLVEKYAAVAEDMALRATETPAFLAARFPCMGEMVNGASRDAEDACAYEFLREFTPRAYRRPLESDELDELLGLQQALYETGGFQASITGVLEAILQSHDFLYRLEFGVMDPEGRLRPSGHEMASRLSYFLWGTMPDEPLFAAAESGELLTNEGVRAQAERMLADPRSREVLRFFFDSVLPISGLAGLQRDPVRYPAYSPAIGGLMREETQRFLEHVVFDAEGTWDAALTAPYTFANGPLAAFYGLPAVEGDEFVQVPLDTSQRLGVLTQSGVVAGTIHSNETNPVVRGAFLMHKILCFEISLPTGDILAEIKPPDPDSGATTRERYAQHSEDPACVGCHRFMDPVGFSLENYDAIGLWRDSENGIPIDASGALPTTGEAVGGPVELVRAIAGSPDTHACFAHQWANFAYGTKLERSDCVLSRLEETFAEAEHHIPTLLLELTQTDAFLYLAREGAGS